MRNIFLLRSKCAGGFHFLPLLLVLCLLHIAGRSCWAMRARRKEGTNAETICRLRCHDVAPPTALRHCHLYIGALWPCHVHCGTVHAVEFTAHALILCTVACCVLAGNPSLQDGNINSAVFVAAITAAFGMFLQPLFAVPYTFYGLIDDRAKYGAPLVAPQSTQDLVDHEVRGKPYIGSRTLPQLSTVRFREGTLDSEDDAETPPQTATGGSAQPHPTTSSKHATGSSREHDGVVTLSTRQAAEIKKGVRRNRVVQDGRPRSVDEILAVLTEEAEAVARKCAEDGVSAAKFNPASCVVVDASRHRALGHAVAFVTCTVAFVVTWVTTVPWCAELMRRFGVAMEIAVAFDVTLAQPFLVAMVWVWHWLLAEEDELHSPFALHPIHGQPIYLGPAWNENVRADPAPLAPFTFVGEYDAPPSDEGMFATRHPPAAYGNELSVDADSATEDDKLSDLEDDFL